MKQFLMLIMLFFLFTSLAYSDEIHLNDGRIIKGKIIKITSKSIEYDPEGDIPFDIFPRGQISKIVYDDGKIILLNEGKEDPKEELKEEPVDEQKDNDSKDRNRENLQKGSGFHRHDGFFFRGIFGYGSGKFVIKNYPGNKADYEDDEENETLADVVYSGTTSIMQVQVGYAFVDNIIFSLNYGAFATAPKYTKLRWDGRNLTQQQKDDAAAGTGYIGPGITYYFMPINIYISGSLGISTTTYFGYPIDNEYGGGSGIEFSIGKEWWVSENWGLGISFIVHSSAGIYRDKVTGAEYNISSRNYGIAFSATYN